MKSKWNLAASVFQVVVGILAVIAFFILSANGEAMDQWIITLLLAVAFVVIGVFGIIDYKSSK